MDINNTCLLIQSTTTNGILECPSRTFCKTMEEAQNRMHTMLNEAIEDATDGEADIGADFFDKKVIGKEEAVLEYENHQYRWDIFPISTIIIQ